MHQTLQTQSILTKAQSYPSRSDAIPTVICITLFAALGVGVRFLDGQLFYDRVTMCPER